MTATLTRYEAPDSWKEKTDGDARWMKVGGASALVDVDTGQILAGCPGLEGEDLDDIGEDEDPENRDRRERKQEQAEAAGWEGSEQRDARKLWQDALEEAPEADVVLVKIGDTYYTFDDHAAHLAKHGVAGDGKAADFKDGHYKTAINRLVAAGLRIAIAEPEKRDLGEVGGDRPEEADIGTVHEPDKSSQPEADSLKSSQNQTDPTRQAPAQVKISGHVLDVAKDRGFWFFRKAGSAGGWTMAPAGLAEAIEQERPSVGEAKQPPREQEPPISKPEPAADEQRRPKKPKPPGKRAERREQQRAKLMERIGDLVRLAESGEISGRAKQRLRTLRGKLAELDAQENRAAEPRANPKQLFSDRLREYAGDDPADREGFRDLVEDLWREKRRQVEEANDAVRNVLGGAAARRAGLVRRIQNADDPDQIPGFDQIVEFAERYYPILLHGQEGESRGRHDAEGALFERLKAGQTPLPTKLDEGIWEDAAAIFSSAKSSRPLSDVSPDGTPWDLVEFAKRKANWWRVTRYRATQDRAHRRRNY